MITGTLETAYERQRPTEMREQWNEAIPIIRLSHWQQEALKRLLLLAHLPKNWDSYGSPPPLEEVIYWSMVLLFCIDYEELVVPIVVPVPGGGVQFEWNLSRKELELEVFPGGTVEFLRAEAGEPIEEGSFEPWAYGTVRSLFGWLTS